ncbi:MAG: hypothetical protein AABW82_01660 [Nanoarchaeota archaeon]
MVRYVSPIDPHVHLRWEEYPNKNYLKLGFLDARAVGLAALVEQGNTSPALTNEEVIRKRLKLADQFRGNIMHGVYVVLTPDEDQQVGALKLVMNEERVCGAKTFLVRSTNSGLIEITDEKAQREAWFLKAITGFRGPDIAHYEDGKLFTMPFDPANPVSHSIRQCPEAEVVQFERQFKNAYDAGYEGSLVVLHTSNPDTIDMGEKLIKQHSPNFKVFYETTFHHMFLNGNDDYPLHGNLVKMNPPLRPAVLQERLLEYVLAGKTHIIGTDHAPHPYEEKIGKPYKSGIPAILFWPKGIELLRNHGMKAEHLEALTFDNSNELYFGGRVKGKIVDIKYAPDLWRRRYGFNPFSRIDGTPKS